MSRDLYINLELHNCAKWNTQDDIKSIVELAVINGELIPLARKKVDVDDNRRAFAVAKEFDKWLDNGFQSWDTYDEEEFSPIMPSERFGGFARTTLRDEWRNEEPNLSSVNLQFGASRYSDLYNFLVINTTFFHYASMLDDPERRSLIDEVALILVNLSIPIIEKLSPSYGVITHREYMSTYGHEVLKAELKYIHWFNSFGPRYVEKYGKQFLLEAPAWNTEELEGGSVVLRLAPTFLTDEDHTEMTDALLEYFKDVGVKKITWP